jgi:hypothetical protein
MNADQIRHLLISYKNSQHYAQVHPRRVQRHRYNSDWIKLDKIKMMPDGELECRFIVLQRR